MIYIIADDLTGATDTGVQFSKQGYRTQVIIASEFDVQKITHSEKLFKESDVLVFDTETRETDASTARHRIRHILQNLPISEHDIIYKKVDSTLRGNVGAELDECLKILNRDICLFTPSFPSNKRITVEGYVIVRDQPLGLSEYYSGNLKPEEASNIPYLLKSETNLPIGRIDLKQVIQGKQEILRIIRASYNSGKKILVADAINDAQLGEIFTSSTEFGGSVLYAGSAGLANALSDLYDGVRQGRANSRQAWKSVLVVSGSMSSTTQAQLEYLMQSIDLCHIPIDIEQLLRGQEKYVQKLLAKIDEAVQSRHHILIAPDPVYLKDQNNQHILAEYHLNFRELGVKIRDFLGELTSCILEHTPINNVIMTGGDTAIGVCSALGIYKLNIKDELLPGIPCSTGRFKEKILNIVTKAGGFGEEDSLYLLMEKLTQ